MGFFRDHVARRLFPAIATLFTRGDGRGVTVDTVAGRQYMEAILRQPVGGVAALVHTGRGKYLTGDEWTRWLAMVVEACHARGKQVIAGVSSPEQAAQARELGADAVLAFPNRHQAAGLDDPARLECVVAYHSRIARAGLPVCAFLLYEQTGLGIHYTPAELRALFAIPGVEAIKSALLSDFELYEDLVVLLAREFPGVVLLTGEDRMFGESLEKVRDVARGPPGARVPVGALVGLGQVLPYLQAFLLRFFDQEPEARDQGQHQDSTNIRAKSRANSRADIHAHPSIVTDYWRARAVVSALARETFTRPLTPVGARRYEEPMEPYVANVLHAALLQYELPARYLYDPATDPDQVAARGIPQAVHAAAVDQLTAVRRERIDQVLAAGLALEEELRTKYGGLEGDLDGPRGDDP